MAKDRNARGQGHELRTQFLETAHFLSEFKRSQKKKRKRLSRKKPRSPNIFLPFYQIKQKYCSRAEDRAFSRACRLLGQGLGLRGQGLQNVSSTTPHLADVLINHVVDKALDFTSPSHRLNFFCYYVEDCFVISPNPTSINIFLNILNIVSTIKFNPLRNWN